MQEEIVK